MTTTVRVYRFMYFDRQSRKMIDSGDFATAEAIREMGGQILTYHLDVDPNLLGPNGILSSTHPAASVVPKR
jgi:hypothetical protein